LIIDITEQLNRMFLVSIYFLTWLSWT